MVSIDPNIPNKLQVIVSGINNLGEWILSQNGPVSDFDIYNAHVGY